MTVKITFDCYTRIMDIPLESRPMMGEQMQLDGYRFNVRNVISTPQPNMLVSVHYHLHIELELHHSEGSLRSINGEELVQKGWRV